MRKFQKQPQSSWQQPWQPPAAAPAGQRPATPQQPSGTEAAKTEAAGDAAKQRQPDAASGEEEPVLVVYTARARPSTMP